MAAARCPKACATSSCCRLRGAILHGCRCARARATPSGVSQHVRKLEDTWASACSRATRSLPTPAGGAFYQRCIEMLRIHEQAKRAVQSYGQGAEGQLVVGLMPTMTRCALAPVLAISCRPTPTCGSSSEAARHEQIRAGELDFAVVRLRPQRRNWRAPPRERPKHMVSNAASKRTYGARTAREPRPNQAGGAGQAQHPAHDHRDLLSNGVHIEQLGRTGRRLATCSIWSPARSCRAS